MSETKLFKDYYDEALARRLGEKIAAVYPAFDAAAFVAEITPQLAPLALKERVALFSEGLRRHLPEAYPDAVAVLLQILGPEIPVEAGMFNDGWMHMPLAHFVEVYGLDDFDVSMHAMYEITKRHSSEFAIRPFLIRYPTQTLAVLAQWVHDPNPHVRRLVSEGARPRLPWAARLTPFIEDPTPTLTLLEHLRDDPSEYVRRSVANHLNDISKDHPDLIVATLRRWRKDAGDGTQWIIGRALRTLVKKGDPDALALLGFGPPQVALTDFTVTPPHIQMGDALTLTFTLHSEAEEAQNLVIDYVMHFMKANGRTAPKVFKLKTAVLPPGDTLTVAKTHTIRPITTRNYYPGAQRVGVQVNGKALAERPFTLEIP